MMQWSWLGRHGQKGSLRAPLLLAKGIVALVRMWTIGLRRERRDFDLNQTFVDFNLNEQVNAMTLQMDLRGGDPTTLSESEWLEVNEDDNVEKYGPDEWHEEVLNGF